MKVKFLKDHLDNKAGDVADVTDERGRYWINTGVVEKHSEKKKSEPGKEKKDNTSHTPKKKN